MLYNGITADFQTAFQKGYQFLRLSVLKRQPVQKSFRNLIPYRLCLKNRAAFPFQNREIMLQAVDILLPSHTLRMSGNPSPAIVDFD